ncbi:MAG: EF-P lysine aminoacylase EpmA [Methylococcales bacterium]
MLAEIRSHFDREGLMEVETPLLCHAVSSDPKLDYFSTMLEFEGSKTGCRLYLQTSPEYSMKRLLAAGAGSIYQIGKAFRNGECGRFHNPEFTILEWYRLGFDLNRLMDDIEALLSRVFDKALAGLETQRISYREVFLKHIGFDPVLADIAEFRSFADRIGDPNALCLCGDDLRLWQEYLFGCVVQPRLGQRGLCLVYDYPANQSALARIRPDDARVAERVEGFYRGIELVNGFHELACSTEQRARILGDLEIRARSGKDLPVLDERLLAALEAGLPDCSGAALGLDRLLMILTDAASIDQVLSFSFARA